MRRIVPALLLVLAISAHAKTKKTPVPAQIANARYVAVVPMSADPNTDWFNSANVTREDREAAEAVQQQLQKWGRYKYTIDPNHADFVIAVRSGRRATAAVGPRINTGNVQVGKRPKNAPDDASNSGSSEPGTIVALGAGAEAGPKEDMIAVFAGTNTGSAPLWSRHQRDGLLGNVPPLFEQFRKDVEETDKLLAEKKKP